MRIWFIWLKAGSFMLAVLDFRAKWRYGTGVWVCNTGNHWHKWRQNSILCDISWDVSTFSSNKRHFETKVVGSSASSQIPFFTHFTHFYIRSLSVYSQYVHVYMYICIYIHIYIYTHSIYSIYKEPCVLYIGRAYRYPPDVALYIYFLTTVSTEYFKHAAHSPFFSSKCRLFHNATFFGSCIIHILHTECAKI